MTMFATKYNCEMNICSNYHSEAVDNEVPSLDDLLAEVNSAFESPSCCKLEERPMTASTRCSATSCWGGMSDPSRPATTTSSTSQVMKVDWGFPGSLDGETSVTLARPLPRKQPVHSACSPHLDSKRVTALPVTPEITQVQGVWFSNGRRGGETVELKVAGDTVTWPSGAEARLVARHEQFCLTSATGKLFSSASVSEGGNGELYLSWNDGSVWSRQPVKDVRSLPQVPCKETVHSYRPPARETSKGVTAVRATPEMLSVEGIWFSNGRNGEPVELKVAGDTVTWPSGTEAKLVARHEQFCLTSATGKLFLSANVSEDGNGEVCLNWTDGSIWSRQPLKDASAEVQLKSKIAKTTDLDSKSEAFVSSAPKIFHKIQKTLGAFKDRNKVHSGRKASMSAAQGRWIIDSSNGHVEVVVDGNKVSWSTGSEAKLVARNGQFMLTNHSGKIYLTGESTTQGTLCWTNGTMWKRSAEWAKEGYSSPAWTEELLATLGSDDVPEQE